MVQQTTVAVKGSQPIRPLLVSRNPVSNCVTPVYDSNVANVGEPLEPLGVVLPIHTPPLRGTTPGMMLPYGQGRTAGPNYAHYQGHGNGGQMANYQFNDIVIRRRWLHIHFCQSTRPAISTSGAFRRWKIYAPNSAAYSVNWTGLIYLLAIPAMDAISRQGKRETATFRELYRAFWSVMAGNPSNHSPFGIP